MPRETGNDLIDFALGQVGESLRTVAVVYEADCEVLYLRDDLKETYQPEQYKTVAASFRTEVGFGGAASEEGPIGRKEAVIHQHRNAFVFQFAHEECHSILLSIDPAVGSQLRSFVTQCQERI